MGLTRDDVAGSLAIPSEGTRCRGQRDGVGFSQTAKQMAEVWRAAGQGPPALDPRDSNLRVPDPRIPGPRSAASGVGTAPTASVASDLPRDAIGAICPHDDYIYAGRIYRQILESLQPAGTILLFGVFHAYRRFDIRDVLVFESFETWRTPDGAVPVSPLRDEWVAQLPGDLVNVNVAAHEYEHSLEALVYWLHHQRPDLQIIPVLVPAMPWARMHSLAATAARALRQLLSTRGLSLGRDVKVAISADAIHYGEDFAHTPFGPGGTDAYERAVERDLSILRDPIHGPVVDERIKRLYETFVDPGDPDTYRVTWCGRFSIPFGLLLLRELTAAEGAQQGSARAEAVAYSTSVGWPELPVRGCGLGTTAPSNLHHFVGYPGAWVFGDPS